MSFYLLAPAPRVEGADLALPALQPAPAAPPKKPHCLPASRNKAQRASHSCGAHSREPRRFNTHLDTAHHQRNAIKRQSEVRARRLGVAWCGEYCRPGSWKTSVREGAVRGTRGAQGGW